MELRGYLIDTFKYNDGANKMTLAKMAELPDKTPAIRFYSHLINSMNKWLARIQQTPGYVELDWWLPVYEFEDLDEKWNECLKAWLEFIGSKTDDELEAEVQFIGFDGTMFAATVKDIALQLNYHAIHHRAQIVYMIRQQGIEPDFVDYIGTRYRRLS